MSKLEVDKIDPQSGTDLELGTSGDTITIPTGVTLDASNATTTLPATVVTTDGTQTLTNKSIATTQLTGTITPSDGTVTNAKIVDSTIELAKLSATGTKDATTFLRGDNTFASAGGTNTPAFEAYLSANQDVGDAVSTKVQFDTELFDTDNCYDNSTNYRFTPTVAGKYYIYVGVQGRSAVDSLIDCHLLLQKNGSTTKEQFHSMDSNVGKSFPTHLQMIVDMNGSTDYLEVFNRVNTNGAPSIRRFDGGSNKQTYFGAYKIIE